MLKKYWIRKTSGFDTSTVWIQVINCILVERRLQVPEFGRLRNVPIREAWADEAIKAVDGTADQPVLDS